MGLYLEILVRPKSMPFRLTRNTERGAYGSGQVTPLVSREVGRVRIAGSPATRMDAWLRAVGKQPLLKCWSIFLPDRAPLRCNQVVTCNLWSRGVS